MPLETPPAPAPTFTPDQAAAYAAIKTGNNVCLTGSAGTGKSYLLSKIFADYGGWGLAVTATTGIAALNVSGCTIHSWAGLGVGDRSAKQIAATIIGQGGRVRDRIRNCKRLAIDEISMMPPMLLSKLDEVLRLVRKNQAPFGGIQMLFIGDFLQLPPVSRGDFDGFAFNSAAWISTGIQVHELRTVVRQSDAGFARVLNKIRVGEIDEEVEDTLERRVCAKDYDLSVKPVKLYGSNAAVDSLNSAELAKVSGASKFYDAIDTGIPTFVEQLRKNCIAPQRLELKVGAQVMLLKNLSTETGLVNGAMGKVTRFEGDWPVVAFNNGEKWHAEPASWEIKDGEEILAARKQIPLRLAWAITIHKSQGMTLDKMEADLVSVFEHGQAYVAVSRAKSLPGLFLTGLDLSKITAHPSALSFYGY